MSAAGLLLCLVPAQEPLQAPLAAAWRPRDGQYAVLDSGGTALHLFDAHLRPLGVRPLDSPAARVAADAGGWLLQGGTEVSWLAGLEGAPLPLSGLRWPAAAAAVGHAGRAWDLEAERRRLGLGPWEQGGEVGWGPGWGTWRARSALVLGPWLEWRRNGGPAQQAAVVADRYDPLLQRAFLEPLAAGDRIELRFRPPTARYPAAVWTPWQELTALAAPPGQRRPVTVLDQDL